LLTYSFTVRPTDVGYLNGLGGENLSLGRLIDQARDRDRASTPSAS